MKKVLFLMVVLAMLVALVIPVAAPAMADTTSSATIQTDKTKYSLGETMIISGSGFTPGGTVNIEVQEPGNNGIDMLVGVTADAAGSFIATYTPPQIPGRYKITANDGTNTALTAATEADAISLKNEQCRNGPLDSPVDCLDTGGATGWVNANSNAQQAHLVEGEALTYRTLINGSGATASNPVNVAVSFLWDTRKSGINAIDYLMYDRTYEEVVDPCSNAGVSEGGTAYTACPMPPIDNSGPYAYVNIDNDLKNADGTRVYSMAKWIGPAALSPNPVLQSVGPKTGSTGFDATPTAGHDGNAATYTTQPANSFDKLFMPTGVLWDKAVIIGGKINDMKLMQQDTLSTDPAVKETTSSRVVIYVTMYSDTAVLAIGGHIASRLEWGYLGTIPQSAGGINGSPYHRSLEGLCVYTSTAPTDCTTGTGAQDIQMAAATVIMPSTLTIVKRIVNDNGGTAVVGDFGITTTAGALTFGAGVADGANTLKYTSNTLTGLSAATYTLHEGLLSGYSEGTWSCTGASGTVVGNPQTGSVTLSAGDNAVCTITNNDNGPSLTLVKRIVNDNGGTAVVGDFGITTTAGALTFGAGVADGANTLKYTSNTLTGLSAGSKTLHEGTLSGYSEGTWSCVGNAGAVNGDPQTGSVVLGLGESVTCTITNNDIPAHLIIIKVVVNDNGGTKVEGDFSGTITGAFTAIGGNSWTGTPDPGVDKTSATVGDYNVIETPDSDYSTSYSADCTGTIALGETKTCTVTNDDKPGTLIVQKITTGAVGQFPFNATGPTTIGNFNLTTVTAGVAVGQSFGSLSTGQYVATEGPHAGWILTDISCTVSVHGGAAVPTGVTDTALGTATVTVPLDGVVTCTFTNSGALTTRTQGFWATHRSLTWAVWHGGTVGENTFPGGLTLGCLDLTQQQLMGGFWAGISKLSNPNLKGKAAQRSTLDQARMQLLQQLLAAILNRAAFGSEPSTGMSIDDAITAFFTGPLDDVKTAAHDMAAFNESGDSGTFTPGASANGKDAKDFAATAGGIAYWDTLPPACPP